MFISSLYAFFLLPCFLISSEPELTNEQKTQLEKILNSWTKEKKKPSLSDFVHKNKEKIRHMYEQEYAQVMLLAHQESKQFRNKNSVYLSTPFHSFFYK